MTDRITLHIEGRIPRTVLNPNDPESVRSALQGLEGCRIVKVLVQREEDPQIPAWRRAVADNQTVKSFEEWKTWTR